MTTFVPEWPPGTGRESQLHRALRDLGDCASVRKPMREEGGAPAYFLDHDQHGWLALAVCTASYAELGDGQLFASDARAAFLAYLDALGQLLPGALPKLVLMWSCSEREVQLLAQQLAPGMDLRLCAREAFLQDGADALRAMMRPLSQAQTVALRRRFFPESEIVSVRVGRRNFSRDNQASLTGMFLDREQEWAAKLDLTLPEDHAELARDFSVRLINGVAGSGKTLVALQRAVYLAQAAPGRQVLLLIHNAPVVADLNERMHRSGRAIPANLAIRTFHSWASRQWNALFGSFPRMARDGELLHLLRQARAAAAPVRLDDGQLFDEIGFINDALITSEESYLAADRTGRGFALREGERSAVWALYRQFDAQLGARRLCLWSALARDICLAPGHSQLARFDHILVDEAQFMAPAALQVMKLALRPGGSLFLCADPRQGFLKSGLSWKSVGLEVAGRTKKLRRSYRTTRALLRAATHLLARAVDDDPEDFLAPDYSGMEEGVPPVLISVDAPQDALDRVVNEVAALARQDGFPLSSILVLYGARAYGAPLYSALSARIGADRIWWFSRDRRMPPGGYGGEHVRLASVDSATGLEGTFVFMLGVEPLLAPPPAEVPARQAEAMARKLYMAMTRSCYRLTVVTAQALPDAALAGVFERRS